MPLGKFGRQVECQSDFSDLGELGQFKFLVKGYWGRVVFLVCLFFNLSKETMSAESELVNLSQMETSKEI